MHIDNIISKASKRLHLITQLKRAQVPVKDLIQIYFACIRSTLEYASPVFHNSLPQYLSSDIERIQRRCPRTIFPESSYEEALELANLSIYLFHEVSKDTISKIKYTALFQN